MCSASATVHTDNEKIWPEEPSSSPWWRQTYNRWTYSYMNEILAKGSEQAKKNGPRLSSDDLYPVPASMTAKSLSDEFRKFYNSSDTPKNDEPSPSSSSLRRFLWTLWQLAAPTFVPAGFCQLLSVLCQVALPLLVRQLLALLEDHPAESIVSQGMPYAVAIFVTSVVNAFGNHRHRHLALKTGVVLRAASVQELYQHVLHLSPAGREGLTSGQVNTLISVDTQKLFEVAQEAHLIWALPLSIILVTALLLWIMGPTTLVGVAVLVLFLPIVERITSGIHKIREVRVQFTDQRVEIVNSMLQGIKVTKLNNYEANYLKRVTEARDLELVHLKKELAVWALSLLVTVSSPVIATAATFATYVLVDEDNILTAAKTFSVLLLFTALRFPINYAGRLIGKAAQAISASQRIARFLERQTRDVDQSQVTEVAGPDDVVLSLSNAGFSIATIGPEQADMSELIEESNRKQNFQVGEFNLELKMGEVLAICGPVGSGKSTFVNGVIDDVPTLAKAVVSKSGRVAYVPQTPFVLNTTFRENILFGQPFQEDLYDRVVDACCLRTDIEQLGEAKDLTEIGERGVTLSGGQKQRVALARAAYSQPDLVLLDDPLSALDAGTAKAVFERLLKSKNALFARAATVLVTHASHFLSQVDRIVIIAEGINRFHGTWAELLQFEPVDETTRSALEFIRSSVQEGLAKDDKRSGTDNYVDAEKTEEGARKESRLMSVEEREFGLSSVRVWVLWFRRAGGWYFLGVQILLMALDRFTYVAVEYWLARWTQAAEQSIDMFGVEFPPQTDGLPAQYKYLTVFASLLCTSVFLTALRSEWAVTGGSRASRRVFASMLERVLWAPMSYFQTTPMGRILNRFTFDTEVIDVLLTQVMSMFLISCSWYVAGVVLMCTILPWMLLAIVPVTAAFWFLLLHYRRSATDLQRLDALSRSPIQAMISEALDGSSTIRVFRKGQLFGERFFSAVDRNSSAMLNFLSSQRWLGIRIELLGSVVVLCSSVLVVALNGVWTIDPGLVGLLILWSGNFTITLGFLIETFGEVEASITAIERVDAMSRIPQERPMVTDETHKVPPSWPEQGQIEFKNVCLRYREGLPLALNNLSFTIPAGKRCGVVGRTGAGKSSLTVALFRLEEIESGCISLDGVDLAGLGLSDVRGRPNGMGIIPQDHFLTGSTLRECLDPFGLKSDQDVLSALQTVRLTAANASYDILNTPLEEGGTNYSVGERQLLNLAAALLSKPKVLVCDEATASIDYESDAFVQRMLRERFENTTLITVAHRLNTIMDYDLILVMDQGYAVELGSPGELLSKSGAFAKLVDATGVEASRSLRAMVGNHAKT